MQTKLSLTVMLALLTIPALSRAESLSLGQIAQELKQDAVIPLAPSVGNQLAKNLMAAQAAASYTQFEPDSLQLSIDAVLKAISLYTDDSVITRTCCSLVWAQSSVAIDDRLTVSFTPESLDFGSQPVATPEPGAWIGLLLGLTLVGGCYLTAHKTAHRAHRIGASTSCPY